MMDVWGGFCDIAPTGEPKMGVCAVAGREAGMLCSSPHPLMGIQTDTGS